MSLSLRAALARYPEKTALAGRNIQLTYAALSAEAERLAQSFYGARAVAILMENDPSWIVVDLASQLAGVVCVPLPPFFTDEQIRHALRNAGVSLLLTDNPDRFPEQGEKLIVAEKTLYAIPQRHEAVSFPTGTAKVTYTSGTTGNPKGVCLTQEAMETVAHSLLDMLGPKVAERHVCLLPLAVLLENIAGVYTALLAGATCYLSPVCHEPKALADAIEQRQATSIILVPELLRMLIASGRKLPSLRYAAVGGARVDLKLLEIAHGLGLPVYEGYGLTECSSVVSLNVPGHNKPGSAGRLLPHIKMRVSPDGEILIQKPLYSGYLGVSYPTEAWYATGDLGHVDEEGYLFIEGRRRNVFITSFGRNVSPEWPESLLTAQPAILQAALFGEAKPFSVAVIVARSPQDVPAAVASVNLRLPDYARIGAYVLADAPFTPANGLLTGNGRNRREAIEAAYRDRIESLYTSHAKEKTA